MEHAAKVMAGTGRRLFEDPALLARAKAAHRRALEAEPYVCPLPDEVMPPIPMAAE
jgi:aminobenzoyl-glutamate utilization protein B